MLNLLAQGNLYKEIAATLNIRQPTVAAFLRRICEKLQVQSRSEAIARMAHLPIESDAAKSMLKT